jgi:bifunctional non-homologous end joining protein LigD
MTARKVMNIRESEAGSRELAFVVQKHRATSLHYDFRLEIGGVMPSWSIPKGPTLDSAVKRLAMRTPDHELEYRHFEGVIGGGSYGAGTVMIWDEGTYRPEVETGKGIRREVNTLNEAEATAAQGLEKGNLKFRLYGSKLRGSFALVRTSMIPGRETWLLIKHKDEWTEKGYNANDYDFSAVSGLTLAQIAGKADTVHKDNFSAV